MYGNIKKNNPKLFWLIMLLAFQIKEGIFMWSSSCGMEYRYQNSPYANGANRIGNPHFNKDGSPASEKAKKICAQVHKVKNDSVKLNGNDTVKNYK